MRAPTGWSSHVWIYEEEEEKEEGEAKKKGMEILKFCMDSSIDFYDFWYGSLGFLV